MDVQELRGRLDGDEYAVDPQAVAEAMLERLGYGALASALAGRPPLRSGGPTPGDQPRRPHRAVERRAHPV